MKFKLFTLVFLALLTASCTQDIIIPEPAEKEGETVIINATIPQEETRVAYNDGMRKLSWQTDDKLLLAGYDANGIYQGSQIFNYTGTGNQFSGTAVSGATTYKAYYPGDVITLDETTGNVQLPATFWEQEQTGNNLTEHLRNKLLLFDEVANPTSQPFQLVMRNDIIKFDLSNISTEVGALKKLIWTVETTSGTTKSMTLNVTGVTFSTGSTALTAFLSFDPTVVNI